jgi:hypothetical protein
MAILMDDQAVARRVLEHIANGTTDVAPGIWREPVENYRSEERLAGEIQLVFRRVATPFCPTAAVSEPGSYVAREAAGSPLLVVRCPYSFTNRGSGDPEARKAAERDAEFVRDAGLAEDRAVVCDIQRSLGSRANEVFTYGLFEGAISHLHRSLAAALLAAVP